MGNKDKGKFKQFSKVMVCGMLLSTATGTVSEVLPAFVSADTKTESTQDETKTSTQTPEKLATPAPRAATTYKAIDLINQGIIKDVKVEWSQTDNAVTNSMAVPKKVTFTLASNSVLLPGDVIDFGAAVYTGARKKTQYPSQANVTLSNGDVFKGGRNYVLADTYNQNASQTASLGLAGFNSQSEKGDASTTIVTATYLNSTTHTIYTWTDTPDPATRFGGYTVSDSSVPSGGGGSFGMVQSDTLYAESALQGNYDTSVGNPPTGNIVMIWHVSPEDAKKIDLTTLSKKATGSGTGYILTADGQHIAGNSNGYVYGTGAGVAQNFTGDSVLSPDMTDAEIVSQSLPHSSGWVKNLDGSLTLYANQGSVSESLPFTNAVVSNLVMNNSWEGTQEGVDQALSTIGDSAYNAYLGRGSAAFYYKTIDPLMTYSLSASTQVYSTDGYSKSNGTKTITISALTAGQEGQSTIKIHYVDQNGDPIKGVSNNFGWPVGSTGNPAGDTLDISADSLKIPNYHLDTSKLPSNISGVNGTTGAVSGITYPAEGTVLDITYIYLPDTFTITRKKVTQTIHYVDKDGKTVAPDKVQEVTFATVKNDQTGATTNYYRAGDHTKDNVSSTDGTLPSAWTSGTESEFEAVENPGVTNKHWISSSVSGDTAKETSVQKVTNSSNDSTVTVTYDADTFTTTLKKVSQTIKYVDDKGNTVAPENKQDVTFATVKNDQTGDTTTYYQAGDHSKDSVSSTDGTLPSPWTSGDSTEFAAVANPTVTGKHWVSSSVSGDTAKETSAQEVKNSDGDSTVTVTFAADTYTTTLKKISQTIKYVDDQGNTVAPDKVQEVTFATVKNDQTGATTEYYQAGDHIKDSVSSTDGTLASAWTSGTDTKFAAVENPTVTGKHWVSSSQSGDTAKETSAQAVKNSDGDSTVTVTFAADTYTVSLKKVTQTISYVDDKVQRVAADHLQEVTFATVKNDQTGATTTYYQAGDHTGDSVSSADGTLSTEWTSGASAEFAAVENPQVTNKHWVSSSILSDTAKETSAQTVTSTDSDATVTVIYADDTYTTTVHKVSQTIHYVDDKGKTVAPDNVQEITFLTVKNDQTGETNNYYRVGNYIGEESTQRTDGKVSKDWSDGTSTDFAAVENPEVSGYYYLSTDRDGDTAKETSSKAVNNTDKDSTVTVVYNRNQVAELKVFDDTTGKELKTEKADGEAGKEIVFSTEDLIAMYEKQGYVLVSNSYKSGETFDTDNDTVQSFEIHFKHGTVTVDPTNPQKPGEPIDPSNPDGPKWPKGTDKDSLTKDITQTIHYVYEDGKEAAPDKTDKVTFTHSVEVDTVTGEISKDNGWKAENDDTSFDAKVSPTIDGYTADAKESKAVKGLAHDSKDDVQTIVYKAKEVTPPVNPVVNPPVNPTVNPTIEPKITVTVRPNTTIPATHTTEPITSSGSTAIPKTNTSMPKTGEEATGTATLMGVLLLGALGWFLSLRKRYSNEEE